MSCEEDAYVIERMGKLLAEIAIIVNGPEPPLTRWSYHDLPEKVRALKQAPPAALAVPVGWVIEHRKDGLAVIAPNCNPGGVTLDAPTGSLARRLLYRLAEAMLAAAERKGVGNEH